MCKAVPWKEVAAFVLAVECYEKSGKEPERLFNELKEFNHEELRNKLDKLQGNQAVNCLLNKKVKYDWMIEKLPLGPLRLGPGGGEDKYSEIASHYEGFPSVKNVYDEIKEMPESEKDQSILNFKKKEDICPFLKKIVVVEMPFLNRETILRIGDGYHRAVISYGDGDVKIECYAGYPI